ncbi:MAG: DUF2852 domain-containing protein [Pseudomonadota bacterium]
MPDVAPNHPARPSVGLQIITTIFYAGFAISTAIVAMVFFGILGLALAIAYAYFWTRLPSLATPSYAPETLADWAPNAPQSAAKSSGNASFDAYRDALMTRLEEEQTNFEGFLGRLRDAKDKAEFDQFLDDRAQSRRLSQATG